MRGISVDCPGGEAGELFKFLPYVCVIARREYMREDFSLFTLLDRICSSIERDTRDGRVLIETRGEEPLSRLICSLCYRLWTEGKSGGICSLTYCHHSFDLTKGVVFQIFARGEMNQRFHGWLDLKWEETT